MREEALAPLADVPRRQAHALRRAGAAFAAFNNRRMVRALRTTPAGAVDLRCSASNVPRTAAVSTIFQELGLPRRRGGGCEQASMVWLCCSSATETISE